MSICLTQDTPIFFALLFRNQIHIVIKKRLQTEYSRSNSSKLMPLSLFIKRSTAFRSVSVNPSFTIPTVRMKICKVNLVQMLFIRASLYYYGFYYGLYYQKNVFPLLFSCDYFFNRCSRFSCIFQNFYYCNYSMR